MGGEGLAQDAAMLPQRLRVLLGAQFVQELGGALHVGEEEGDRSRGEFGSHRIMMRQMKILGATPSCKHPASIGLPQRCHRVPPKCTAAAENQLETCF